MMYLWRILWRSSQAQILVQTYLQLRVMRQLRMPAISNHFNAHFPRILLALGSCLSQNLMVAPATMRSLMRSHLHEKISSSSLILKACSAMYKGHLCYLRHLHSSVEFLMRSFINFVAERYWLLLGPLAAPSAAALVMKRLKELMKTALSSWKMELGLALARTSLWAVSQSSRPMAKKSAWSSQERWLRSGFYIND